MNRAGLLGTLLCAACGSADEGDILLPFETQPSCPAADASCVNAGTETLSVGGIPLIYRSLPGHPLVAIQVSFDSRLGSSRQSWAESFALDLFERRGSRRFTTASWAAEQLRLESRISAGLGTDYSSIHAVAPRFNWREVWDLVFEGMTDVGDSDRELANLEGIAAQSLLSERDDPDLAAHVDALSRLFYRHPYYNRREHPETISTIASSDIQDAWATLCTDDRLLVAVVGDVDAFEVVAALQDALDALRARARSVAFLADDALPNVEQPAIQILPYPEAPTWHIASYFRGPDADSPDYARLTLALDVLNRRLFREIRDVRGLAYTTGAGLSFYRDTAGAIFITSNAPLEAIPVARQVIADLERDGPTEDELAAARAGQITALLTASDTPAGLASKLVDWHFTAGHREALDDYLAALQRATPAEIATAATQYLRDIKTAAAGGGSSLTETDVADLFPNP